VEHKANDLIAIFPVPWKITDTGSAFRISDAHGRVVDWCYYRRESALRTSIRPGKKLKSWRRISQGCREPDFRGHGQGE